MAQTAFIEIELSNGNKAGQTLKELTQTANRLNKEITNLKPGSDEFVKKSKDYQVVTKRLGDVRSEVKGVTEQQKALVAQLADMTPFGGQIQALGGNFKNMTGAIGGATKGMTALKIGIASTGIGVLVLALGSLVTWLSSTQAGMDKVNSVLRPLSAIFQRLIGLVQDLGGKAFKGLGEAIKNPQKALEDFGNFIKDNFINRITSVGTAIEGMKMIFNGDFLAGGKKLIDAQLQGLTGVKDMTDKINAAAQNATSWINDGIDAGKQLHDLQIQIDKAEINSIRTRDAMIAQTERYKFILEDETASLELRKQTSIDALKLMEQIMAQDKNLLDLKIRKMELEHSLNDTSREQEKELAALYADRGRLEGEIMGRRIEIRNKYNEFVKKENEAAVLAEQKIVDAMLAEDERLKEEMEKRMDEIAELRKKNHGDQIMEADLAAEEMKIKTEMAFADRLITEQERQDQLYALEEDRLQKQLDAQIAYYGAESLEAKKAMNAINAFKVGKRKEDLVKSKKAEEEHLTDKEQAAHATMSIAGNVFGGLAEQYEQGSEEYKKFAFLQAQSDTFAASLAAYKSTAAIPIVGPALAPVAAAAAMIFGQIKSNQIRNMKKAERGMVLRGPRHSQGGILVEAEGGEVILNRNVGNSYEGLSAASELNARFGGAKFMEAGGPVNPFSARQIAAQGPAVMGGSTQGSYDQLINEFRLMRQDMTNWQRTLQVVNNVQDTRKGINVINKLETDSGF